MQHLIPASQTEQLAHPWEPPQLNFWLDISDPGAGDLALLREKFNFHQLSLEDIQRPRMRPKVNQYDHYLFMVLQCPGPLRSSAPSLGQPLYIFLSQHFLVSWHKGPLPFLERIRREYQEHPALLKEGPDYLLYRLADALADSYVKNLDQLENRLDKVEENIFRSSEQQNLDNQIFRLRRRLISLRKILGPQRDLFNLLLRYNSPFIQEKHRFFYNDIYDQYLRLLDQVETYHDLIDNLLEAHLSATSNRLNETVKVLTIITTIMMPLTIITGIYGMNFDLMPELHWHYGYLWALGWMAVSATSMFLYFRHRKWI